MIVAAVLVAVLIAVLADGLVEWATKRFRKQPPSGF